MPNRPILIPPAREGFTLAELLVTLTLIALMALLMIPAWKHSSEAWARKSAMIMSMEALGHGRNEAVSARRPVWLLFRHIPGTADAWRILAKGDNSLAPLTSWKTLPPGISFRVDSDCLTGAKPPGEIVTVALSGATLPPGSLVGGVMFLPSGSVGFPARGGGQLCLSLESPEHKTIATILLSRASGKATLQ